MRIIVDLPDCDVSLHSWPQCPEGDFRPEAILSRSFGSSGTATHRQVTLYKGPESSDLDFWFHSTPFWCKNHFCSFKTEGVTNILPFSVIVKLRVIFGNIRFKLCWKVLSQRYRYKGDTKSWRWPHIKSLHTWQLTMQNASVQRPSCRSCKCFNVVHLQTNTAHTIYYELRIIGQQCRRWSWSRVTNKWKLNVHFRTRFSVVISPIKRWLITYYLLIPQIHSPWFWIHEFKSR